MNPKDPQVRMEDLDLLKAVFNHLSMGLMVAEQNGKILFFNPEAGRILGMNLPDGDLAQWIPTWSCYRGVYDQRCKALEQTADSVIITDRQGVIEYVNPAFEQTTGYATSEVLGQTPKVLKSGYHDADFYKALWDRLLAADGFRVVVENEFKKAINSLAWRRPDLVLLDLHILAKDNTSAFSAIRKMQSHPPMVFLVEPQFLCLAGQLAKNGNRKFVTKPIDYHELRKHLRLIAAPVPS